MFDYYSVVRTLRFTHSHGPSGRFTIRCHASARPILERKMLFPGYPQLPTLSLLCITGGKLVRSIFLCFSRWPTSYWATQHAWHLVLSGDAWRSGCDDVDGELPGTGVTSDAATDGCKARSQEPRGQCLLLSGLSMNGLEKWVSSPLHVQPPIAMVWTWLMMVVMLLFGPVTWPYLLEVVLRILLPVLPPDLGAQLTCQSIYTTNERSYPGNPGELQLE
jgi:hypothetical protein